MFYFEYISKSTSAIERSRIFYSLFGLVKLHHMKFGCKQYQETHLQRAIPVKKSVPPTTTKTFPGVLCVPCGIIVSQTTLRHMISTQKGDCMLYVLCGIKEEGARGNSFLSAKYSCAYVHTASRSENRSVAPQNHQNISEAKYFSKSREQFRVLFILKINPSSISKIPCYNDDTESQTYTREEKQTGKRWIDQKRRIVM